MQHNQFHILKHKKMEIAGPARPAHNYFHILKHIKKKKKERTDEARPVFITDQH